jgi:hypothetical protein
MIADPMLTDGGNESRAEILARVTFAELRWTVDELGLKGADTDRGDVHVRYGPADVVAVFGPNVAESAADVMTFWMYRSGLMFGFTGMSGFGTARVPHADAAMVAAMKEAQPVRFDNLSAIRPDSMFVQLARFRGDGDSIDVHVSAAPPVNTIRQSMTVAGPVRADVWLIAATATVAQRDSMLLDTSSVRAWTLRARPGSYLLRVEASASNAARAARFSSHVQLGDGFASTGAGISDVLVAAHAAAGGLRHARWRDITLTPAVRTVAAASQMSLVWENYDFGARNGATEYSVSVTITRQRSTAGAIVARVTGALASIARVDTKRDVAVITFDRTLPHAAIVPDFVNVDLAETPPSMYSVALDVRDRVTGAAYSRSVIVTIAK